MRTWRRIARLFAPVRFLQLRARGLGWYCWTAPAAAAAAVTAWVAFAPAQVAVFGGTGLLSGAIGVLQPLVGFFIAALAAVATFHNEHMDQVHPNAPMLGSELLTRRRWLSMLFGYLAVLSFVLLLAAVLLAASAEALRVAVGPAWHREVRLGLVAILALGMAQLVSLTLFGLAYLADEMHRTPE